MPDDDKIKKCEIENEELKKLNNVKSDLISISAHQLRTSLSAVKWILKMFIDRDFGDMTTEQENFANRAFDSNERMIKMVNEMLSINHAEDMTLSYDFEKHDLVKLIESVLFDFTGESYKRGIEIIFLKPESLAPFMFDEEKIRVVLQNLIENSIKYSNTGDKVFVTVSDKDDVVNISVRDTGIGIAAGDQPRIFEKFFRADNAQKKDPVGSGLGLFTTKSIVEKHGGKIWLESTDKGGTTFFVDLPKKPSATSHTGKSPLTGGPGVL